MRGVRRLASWRACGCPILSAACINIRIELSGGMRQRVMIGMSLLCEPKLVIADEPTSALDVTVQAQLIELLRTMRAELGMALVLISHDLGVVAGLADRILVMYAGRIVESAPAAELFSHAAPSLHRGDAEVHTQPFRAAPRALADTCGLTAAAGRAARGLRLCTQVSTGRRALPLRATALNPGRRGCGRLPFSAARMNAAADPLLRVKDLRVDFGAHAVVRGVSFELFAGETLGLVGESGSGKSTLARAILRLLRSAHGSVEWRGKDLLTAAPAELRAQRRDLQIVFQDPLSSLDPRMRVGDAIAEPLRIFEPGLDASARARRVAAMLERVGLTAAMGVRYPHEFSGGQCQRIGIARAMILNPKLLICDEPVSSLDLSIQGQIINLLLDLQRDAGTAMLFISHNLAVVRHLSHRVLVMYSGKLVEIAAPRCVVRLAPAPLYDRAIGGRARDRTSAHRRAGSLKVGRTSRERGPAWFRLRLPGPLSLCITGVRKHRAAARASRHRALGCLSSFARGSYSAILACMTQRKPVRPSDGLANVRYEIRGKLARRALALERLGYDIVSLNIGNPYAFGFRTPETMRLAMIENLRHSEGYVHQKGIFPAREAVVMQQQERGVRGVTAEEVFIGNGVSELIDLTLRALLNPGDEVLVPSPDYPLWTAAVNLNTGRAVHYPCHPARAFIPDPDEIEALITRRTRAIVIVNPNNPTGAVYPRETLSAIARIAEKHRLVVLCDEIYDHILYDGAEFVPMATLVHNTLCCTMSGLSKVYRACGYRVGWASFSGDIESAGDYLSGLELLSSLRLCSNVPGQWAVQTALGGYQSILEMTRPGGRLYDSRQAILDGVARSKYLKLSRPMGALYSFVEVRSDVLPEFDDQAFALELLETKHVLVAPGVSFNVPYRNAFRITNLPERQILATVFARIEELLDAQAAAGPELKIVGSAPEA